MSIDLLFSKVKVLDLVRDSQSGQTNKYNFTVEVFNNREIFTIPSDVLSLYDLNEFLNNYKLTLYNDLNTAFDIFDRKVQSFCSLIVNSKKVIRFNGLDYYFVFNNYAYYPSLELI